MLKLLLASSVLALPLVACVDTDDAADPDLELLEIEPPAEVRLDGDPADALFGVHEYGTGWDHEWIEVCWEDSAYSNDPVKGPLMAEARQWVNEAVRTEWGRVSKLKFLEIWPSCDSPWNQPDIRIGHHEVDGWSMHGTEARALATGPTMAINLLGPAASTCVDTGSGSPGGGGGGYIPMCNGTLLGADPASRQNWTEALSLHLFGYALGLRKEDVHPDAVACSSLSETLDGNGDGEALWAFDTTSLMRSCRMVQLAYGAARPTLSAGDIQSINSLYPGVVRMFPNDELGGTSWPLGPGYHDRVSHPNLATVSSIVIPPGFRAKLCTSSVCTTYTSTRRALTATYNNNIQNVEITVWANVAEKKGFLGANQWFTPGTYKASQGQLAIVGNNAASSAWVAPGQAITLCDGETPSLLSCISAVGGTFGVPALLKLPGTPQNQFAGFAMDNLASYVKVAPRVVTYSSTDFAGASYSVAEGVYKVSTGSTYLGQVRALLVPAGLEAEVCNGENPLSFPRPTCQTLTESGPLSAALQSNVKRLEVRVPLVNAP
ncbi:MAG TPA: hypothetical protein VM261_30990 [Kofleriaceae bacterium]|nr:hypothetical protein [Kofleriaceae bacterium]